MVLVGSHDVPNSGSLESLPQRWSKGREDQRLVYDILKPNHVSMRLEDCDAGSVEPETEGLWMGSRIRTSS
jgi:hypothetical protein